MSVRRRHPSSRQLDEWTQTGNSQRVGNHITECERCTALLDSEVRLSNRQQQALALATEAPFDLESTMTVSVAEAVRKREALMAVADLFTLGWETPRAVLGSLPEGEQ